MVLIIDNYDSFTYNLYHYFLRLKEDTIVKSRDEVDIEYINNLSPNYIVLSPGPGNPDEAKIIMEIIDSFKGKIPILGVCLGHQYIGSYFGGEIVKGDNPVHGKVFKITHNNQGIFKGLKNPLNVTRYHSLVISRNNFPDELEITSRTEDGVIMGIRHKVYNIHGVQFHPEAILTESGIEMLDNFLRSDKE